MDDPAIAVLTRESVGEILSNRGVGGLTLQPRHARKQRYVVCIRNDRNSNPDSGEPHRTAFLVGTVSGLEVTGEQNGTRKWRILFDTVARASVPDVGRGWRNPVVYRSLRELGIDASSLAFSRCEEVEGREEAGQTAPLTISQAKTRLARSLGVRPDQVEITIKA